MFEKIVALPADPILGLNQSFHQDKNPNKINLSVGVYQDAQGHTPVFTAVKKAERQLLEKQKSKAYIAQAGDAVFLDKISRLLLGDSLIDELGDRVVAVATPGGCGALRMTAELLVQTYKDTRVWVSDPTWANHYPLLESAGLNLSTYAYYDQQKNGIDFAAMLDCLQRIPAGDVVLLHGSCHNPTGADISKSQWDQVIEVMQQRNLVPFIDMAYQGFGDGLIDDAYGVRLAVEKLPEVLICDSCSKNFGLYRERTGAVIVVTESAKQSLAAKSYIMSAARRSYSMSPYHGSGIVGHLLSAPDLTKEWQEELENIRNRMDRVRIGLAEGLNEAQSKMDFSFVARSKGMFCFLGITRQQVLQLRSEHGLYLLESTRINVAGLSQGNLPVVVERVADALND
ncbi:MAG: aspartate/tyrosine/aromatic aminotransferase [Acidiferrobacterales bacterium]|nr:aspartate/tyrosine/aromatic aminotransferase [Acidiferrobacterales bacterium]